eukprot:scaffold663281_cov64-Prasinocladus_malaysianus.AAC.1
MTRESPSSTGVHPQVVESWEKSLSSKCMDVCFCASECAPWSKTGGLGDVMGAVPKVESPTMSYV